MNTSSSASSAPNTNTTASTASTAVTNGYRLPENTTLQHAVKLSIVEDKPIMLDYWTASLEKSAIIGVRSNGDKLLVKSKEEYTSSIANIYKVKTEYIVVTENSIYIVDVTIPTRTVS